MIEKAKAFFSNPLVGGIGSVASLLGLAVAVYFFIASQKHRELSFTVSPTKTTVVTLGESSRLEVFHGGARVDKDLTAAQVTVWNAGEDSIRDDHILENVILSVSGGRILEADIRNVSREVCEISISLSNDGKLLLGWKILEQNDGASIQIVYTGTPDNQITLEGVIEGQRSISKLLSGERIYVAYVTAMIFGIGGIFNMSIATAYLVHRFRRRSPNSKRWFWISAFILAGALCLYFVTLTILSYSARPVTPPIGL